MKEKEECVRLIDDLNNQRKKDKAGLEESRMSVERERETLKLYY